ncbi:hypothetical protein B6U93_03355 [Candidatus Woesearchaeota archaeon ex4484_78]|nr:MAG: hypothetical protein B6U93_03355 [Candidatus Woesearchaeota archaeon ex4484_78]
MNKLKYKKQQFAWEKKQAENKEEKERDSFDNIEKIKEMKAEEIDKEIAKLKKELKKHKII